MSSQNSIWEAAREKLRRPGTASPTGQVLIISGGVVTPQPDSGSHWPPGITWPAVSFLIGCRLTTCRFSPLPPCANCVANLIPAAGHSPSRCNYAPLCLMLHWWPHTHLCPGCLQAALLVTCHSLTSVRCLLIPHSPLSPPARPESPCAAPLVRALPYHQWLLTTTTACAACCCWPGELVSTTDQGDSQQFWVRAVLIIPLVSHRSKNAFTKKIEKDDSLIE